MNDHFYLTLSSDSSRDRYPHNTVTNYSVNLPERLRLDDDYEVGLTELVFPHNWFNVDNSDDRFWFATYNFTTNKFPLAKTVIKSGHYADEAAFAAGLTEQITRHLANAPDLSARITFVAHARRMRLRIDNSDATVVILSPELLQFMGFQPKLIAKKQMDLIGTRPFDINDGFHLAYVHCDLIANNVVGDVTAPLLRVFDVSGQQSHIVFERPQYKPLARRIFDTIRISINKDGGQAFPIDFGTSTVRLHFRRK